MCRIALAWRAGEKCAVRSPWPLWLSCSSLSRRARTLSVRHRRPPRLKSRQTVDIGDLGAESITVQPFGDFLMSSGDLVWVSGVAPGIVAYDDTMEPVFEIDAGTVWAALESGHGFIWASEATEDAHATTLLRIDPATGTATRFALPLPAFPEESSIAVTDDAVWAIIPAQVAGGPWTWSARSTSGELIRTLDVGTEALAAVRGGFGSLWVTRPTGMLARIDPVSGDVLAEIELPLSSTFLAIGPDAVWVMNQLGDVSRVDPETDEVVATITANPSGIIGGDIVATADAVWVQATTLLGVEIDPSTNAVVSAWAPRRKRQSSRSPRTALCGSPRTTCSSSTGFRTNSRVQGRTLAKSG